MSRFWSILFLSVPIWGVALFVFAALEVGPFYKHWFPDDISEKGYVIDNLFNSIMYLTGLIFIVTSLALFWFLWKYDGSRNQEPVKFSHGSHTLEIIWSILPAATLVFIAVYQMDAWAKAKMIRPTLAGPDGRLNTVDDLPMPPIAEVTGRQFEWRIRYASTDGIIGTADDVFTVNELHLPAGEQAVLTIKSMDVLHNFFLPNVRVKNDVVPGMKQFVWFTPNHPDGPGTKYRSSSTDSWTDGEYHTYDIVCAELCGWGHYKMKGRMTIQSAADFAKWLKETKAAQVASALPPSEEDEDE